MVYLCSGTDSEKLDWFKTINIAGEKLTDQELRNAVYAGPWVTDAKRYFSKTGCPAYGLGSDYMSGAPIRQDYLETVIKWINDGDIEGYMATHQHEPNANELWLYFQSVIAWVKATFPKYRRGDEGRPVGRALQPVQGRRAGLRRSLRSEIATLMADEDVTKKKGIYSYVLDGRRSTSTSGRSARTRSARPTSGRRASALSAASTSRSRRWKPTTSPRGTRAARPRPPTARCSAWRTTAGRAAKGFHPT